jgi:hypothetical protein
MFCDKRSPLVSPGRAKSAQADCRRAAARGAAVLDGAQQLVLADDPLRLLHEINQQVEDLRLDHDRLAAAPQLAARDIEDYILEPQPHAVSTTRRGVRGGLARFMTK